MRKIKEIIEEIELLGKTNFAYFDLRNEDFLLVNPQYTEWFADIKKRIGNGII